jgi:hypothetical protein
VRTLIDGKSLAVLDEHISTQWEHDTKTGPQIVRRNADDLLSVGDDKAFHNWITKHESKTYSQRIMAETSYSTMKRSFGDPVRVLGW